MTKSTEGNERRQRLRGEGGSPGSRPPFCPLRTPACLALKEGPGCTILDLGQREPTTLPFVTP